MACSCGGGGNSSKMAIEHNFLNWMSGYSVFMVVVLSANLKCGWHLVNDMSNTLKAHTMAK